MFQKVNFRTIMFINLPMKKFNTTKNNIHTCVKILNHAQIIWGRILELHTDMYGSHGLMVQILVESGKSYNHKRSSATLSTIKFVHRSTQILCVPHIHTMNIELIWLTFRFSFCVCVWVCFQIEFEFSRTDCFKNSGKDLEDCSASNRVS